MELCNQTINKQQALLVGKALNVDFNKVDFEQFRRGLEVELEHGLCMPDTNVTGDDLLQTAKIALAHLSELPDYYTRLDYMEMTAAPQKANRLGTDHFFLTGALAGLAGVLLLRRLLDK